MKALVGPILHNRLFFCASEPGSAENCPRLAGRLPRWSARHETRFSRWHSDRNRSSCNTSSRSGEPTNRRTRVLETAMPYSTSERVNSSRLAATGYHRLLHYCFSRSTPLTPHPHYLLRNPPVLLSVPPVVCGLLRQVLPLSSFFLPQIPLLFTLPLAPTWLCAASVSASVFCRITFTRRDTPRRGALDSCGTNSLIPTFFPWWGWGRLTAWDWTYVVVQSPVSVTFFFYD